jgi:hypothetical protein
MSPPCGVATASPIQTKFGRVGVPYNVITHAKLYINQFIIETLARGFSKGQVHIDGFGQQSSVRKHVLPNG